MEPITAFAWIVPLWQMLIEMAHVIVSSPAGCWTPREGQEILPVLLKPTPWTNELRCFPFSTYSNCYWGWPHIFPGLSQISRKTLIWNRVKSGSNERWDMARWRQAMTRIHNPCVIEAICRMLASCSCPGTLRSLSVPDGKRTEATRSSRGKTGLRLRIFGKALDRNWRSPRQGLAPRAHPQANGSWYVQPKDANSGPLGVCRWQKKGQEPCCHL